MIKFLNLSFTVHHIGTKNSNCVRGSVGIKIKLYTQAQFTSAFIVLTDVWLFLNILNYTNTKQMRGGLHQDSYCVLWGWHLTASRFEGRVPNRFFGIQDFHYLKLGIRDLKEKSGRVSSMHGRWDAKNNPRNYATARNFGSGLRDWRERENYFITLVAKNGRPQENTT